MSRTKRRRRARAGMTLVEVLAVVVILGLIAGTLLVGFGGTTNRARYNLAKSQVGTIMSSLEKYNLEHSEYPNSLDALSSASPGDSYFLTKGQLLDPWDREFGYTKPGPNGFGFEVVCFASDGEIGGEGHAKDISSTDIRGEGD